MSRAEIEPVTDTSALAAGSTVAGHADDHAGHSALLALNNVPEGQLARHADTVAAAFRACRGHSLELVAPLSAEDMQLQSMPDASPSKWHLAHTTWFFETFILQHFEPGFRWFNERYCVLFNSYYNGIGEQFSRPQRGLLSRPSTDKVFDYRAAIDQRIAKLLEQAPDASVREICSLLRLGVNHEQQHQELLITDIKHALAQNPAWPSYTAKHASASDDPGPRVTEATGWIDLEPGNAEAGFAGEGFHFDNEGPRHTVCLPGCRIARQPVNNGEWLEFMEAGGYTEPMLWLDEGWAWRCAGNIEHPLYWRQNSEGWHQFTLRGEQPLATARPVTHISFYEADAFSRWAGARLPTEFEWEAAAMISDSATAAAGCPVQDEFTANWAWTGSAYLPYPGFQTAEGAVGEYNGKFMINQMVLRGRSGATAPGHSRISYRNFFPAPARWQYTGLHLARNG